MGYKSVNNLDGERIVVGGSFKGDLQGIVKKCLNPDSSLSKEEVLTALMEHEYIVFNPQMASIGAKRGDLYKESKKLFDDMRTDLRTGAVTLTGYSYETEKIDDSKLGRKILLRRVAPGKLLFLIERHPHFGSSCFVKQFWLYDSKLKVCELIGNEIIIRPTFGPILLQSQGEWKPATGTRDSFHELIKSLLGEPGLSAFLRKTNFQPDLFLDPPKDIQQECEMRIGEKIEQPKPTKEGLDPAQEDTVFSLNMTKGTVVHGLPKDFFLYKLRDEIKATVQSGNVSLDIDHSVVTVTDDSTGKAATFKLDTFDLEITSDEGAKFGKLNFERGRPTFETDYKLTFECGGKEYSFSELILELGLGL